MHLYLATVMTLALACNKREAEPPPRLPAPIPSSYPLPAGERLVETAKLGRVASFVFDYQTDAAEVLAQLTSNLRAAGWSVQIDKGRVSTTRDGLELVASADGKTITVEAIAAAPAIDARGSREAPRKTAPPNYPAGFPWVAGGIRQELRNAPEGSIGLIYPGKTAKQLAVALRAGAERRRWMCTEEPLEFVCALGTRSVDLRIANRRGEVEVLLIESR